MTARAEQLPGCAELMEPAFGVKPPLFGLGAGCTLTQRVFWQHGVSPGRLGRGMEMCLSLVPEHSLVRKGVINNIGEAAV